jgi:protein TonB
MLPPQLPAAANPPRGLGVRVAAAVVAVFLVVGLWWFATSRDGGQEQVSRETRSAPADSAAAASGAAAGSAGNKAADDAAKSADAGRAAPADVSAPPREAAPPAADGEPLLVRARTEWKRGDVSAALSSVAAAQQADPDPANERLLNDFLREARTRAATAERVATTRKVQRTAAYRTAETRRQSAEQLARSNLLPLSVQAYMDVERLFTEAARTAAPAPVRVGGAIKPPRQTKRVDPEYPSMARSARLQGIVILEVTIGTDGSVTDARVLRSIPLLDTAARDAVRQWQYEPTIVDGAAVPVLMTVAVRFTLTPAAPVRVGGQVKAPAQTKRVNPPYPPEAQAAGVQGIVILEATIGADGKVTDVRVLRSIPLLDQAALDAVRQWEYVPTVIGGVAVPVVMTVTVSFTLKPAAPAPAAAPPAN